MSISLEEFQRIQNEVLRLKGENHTLAEQIKTAANTSQTFLHSLFSTSENSEIERLQREESELKKSFASISEHNEQLREQCRNANTTESINDQIAMLESLFMTKKRELVRMHELNATTLQDLEEEVELARELCDSLENGRSSLTRDKEVIENSILSLQAARQSIDSRIRDLEALNKQLRSDLGVKAADESENADLASQIAVATHKLHELQVESDEMNATFSRQERELQEILKSKQDECTKLDENQSGQNAQIEEQLKALRHELQSLKSRTRSEDTVEIDVDSLVKENEDLQIRIDDLERKKQELTSIITVNQTDCTYLTKWLKTEQQSHGDIDSVLKELIKKECEARDELARLQATQTQDDGDIY